MAPKKPPSHHDSLRLRLDVMPMNLKPHAAEELFANRSLVVLRIDRSGLHAAGEARYVRVDAYGTPLFRLAGHGEDTTPQAYTHYSYKGWASLLAALASPSRPSAKG